MHTKGRAAPETKASIDQARSLLEKADELGETFDDPLVRLSMLYGLWNANYILFSSKPLRDISAENPAVCPEARDRGPVGNCTSSYGRVCCIRATL